MKHRSARLIGPALLAAIASGCGGSGPVEADQPTVLGPQEFCRDHSPEAVATFEDSKLDSNVRVHLAVGADENITCAMLSTLTAFGAGQWAYHFPPGSGFRRIGIESIAGIQNLTELSRLSLDNNDIEEIGLLSGLTDLRALNLQRNNIVDVDALTGLTGLTDLRLSGVLLGIAATRATFIQDGICEGQGAATSIMPTNAPFSAPGRAPPIGGYNRIPTLDALSALTNLTFLTAGSDGVTDISAISGLTALECLGLTGELAPGIDVLAGLTNLKELWLANNSISDVTALAGLTGLTALSLADNSITDISPLSGLTGLRELSLGHNSVADVSALSGFTGLKLLSLTANPISDIDVLLTSTGFAPGAVVHLRQTLVSCGDVFALSSRVTAVLSDC